MQESLVVCGEATPPRVKAVPVAGRDSSAIRRLVRMSWQFERGNFSNVEEFYRSVSKDDPLFPLYAGCTLIGAVGLGQVDLLSRVYADLMSCLNKNGKNATPSPVLEDTIVQKVAEIVLIWIRQMLHIEKAEPNWLRDLDFAGVPSSWKLLVGFLNVRMCVGNGDFKTAYVIVKLLLEVYPHLPGGVVAKVYLLRACAEICRDLGRYDESALWFEKMASLASRHGFIRPYLGLLMGPQTPAEKSLLAVAPDMVKAVKKRTNAYFKNLVRFHNHLTGRRVTEDLSPREFYIAQGLKRKWSYQCCADNMNVSLGRLNILVRIIYEKLNIHSRTELETCVW